MAEIPKRELIKQEIIETLKTIKRSNGFLTDVARVTDELKLPDEIEITDFPFLSVLSGDHDYSYATNRSIDEVMKPIIFGYVRGGEERESNDTLLNRLIYDVRKCLLSDKKRSERAEITYIDSVITDKGVMDRYGAFEMSLRVSYREQSIV